MQQRRGRRGVDVLTAPAAGRAERQEMNVALDIYVYHAYIANHREMEA